MKFGLFLGFTTLTFAQTLVQPPPLVRIVQSGPRPAVESPAGDPASGVFLFGLTALTGPAESWLIETHNSFDSLEQFDQGAARGRNGGGEDSRSLIAFYRQWWSHRPEEALQALRKARYLQISLYRIAVGAENDLAEILRARRASLDSINLDRPDLVYQVVAGAPSGTFLLISPLPSLRVLDEGVSRSAAAYLRSTGSPSSRNGPNRPVELSHENLIFRLDPRLSVVSDDFGAAAPDFWQPRRAR